jgi:hypothetical protein
VLTAAGSSLVAGSIAPGENSMFKKVKVLRPFMWNRKATVVGEVVELPAGTAFEVVGANKAVYVTDPPVAAEPESASKARGSKKDAG